MRLGLAITLSVLGCRPPEPVLSGIPNAPILSATADDTVKPDRAPEPYAKTPDIYVDIRHLCGKPLERIKVELHEQLGQRQNVRALSGSQGQEIQFTRGRVRVHDGIVYMVSVPLNEPRYRREALQLTGFPPYSGGVIRTSREYRLNNQWDFRRIRMKRAGRDAEQVTEVEAWRWLPQERQ